VKGYNLSDDFVDADLERATLAAVAQAPALYWELLDTLPAGAFVAEPETWSSVAKAIEAEERASVPGDWKPASDPQASAQLLADLFQRRLLAEAQERLALALHDRNVPASELATMLEAEAASVQAAIRETASGRLTWASDLLDDVLRAAEERARQLRETGNPVPGLPTGIARLDARIGGLQEGLTLLAGAPGVGKTTLALQTAGHVSRFAPVVYVTFENSPMNLATKAICALGGVNPIDVARGTADLQKLHAGAASWRETAGRIALIEGTAALTVAQIRATALRAMNRHRSDRCLVVVDYLQLMAKASAELRGMATVRERVETLGAMLRELSTRLRSPVLSLASQNRAEGRYGDNKGSAELGSLKESGDLEYGADLVLFLTPANGRQSVAPARAVDVTIAKNRNGDTGRVELIFRPDVGTLREVANA
jgi:replicative DNA helicase